MVQVPAGSPFTAAERFALDEAIRKAEQSCRAEFSVFVGACEGDSREFATRLHNTLVAPSRSVLIMLDPKQRLLEVVTGGHVRRTLTDEKVGVATITMQSAFAEGDLVGGLIRGIRQLAEYARAPETLHAE